jgi:hypothetical protein
VSPRTKLLPLLGIVLALAAVGIMSCSKDDPAPTAPTIPTRHIPTVHHYPLGDGTWRVVTTLTPTTGSCWDAGVWVDTLIVAGGVPDSNSTDPFAPAPFNLTGSKVTQTYSHTEVFADTCSVELVATGSGTVGATSFTFSYNLSSTAIGDCSEFGVPTVCRARLVLACTRIEAAPGPVSAMSGRPASPARGNWLARLKQGATK